MIEQTLEDLRSYIETNLPAQLKIIETQQKDLKLGSCDVVVVGSPDLEKYKKNTQCFLDIDEVLYEYLTNESDESRIQANIIFTFRGFTSEDLMKKMLRYSEAFYALVKNNSTFDCVDDIRYDKCVYYPQVSANENMKAIEIALTIRKDV